MNNHLLLASCSKQRLSKSKAYLCSLPYFDLRALYSSLTSILDSTHTIVYQCCVSELSSDEPP